VPRSQWSTTTSPTVERLLRAAALPRLIVSLASPPSTLSSVVPSTAKGTEKIPPTGITRMSEKPYSAVPTASQATLQLPITLHGLVERLLILLSERDNAILSMPIGTKRETFRQSDDKNARFSVMIRMLLNISSSYTLEAEASRGRTGSFLCADLDDP
jgi:hypothetical protein